MRRSIVSVLVAAFFALIGPRAVGPRSHPAGAPFAYEPPAGFTPSKPATTPEGVDAQGAKVWTFDPSGEGGAPVAKSSPSASVVLTHSRKEMGVEERELAQLANAMHEAFDDATVPEERRCTWSTRRSELRTRPDGARVGLIEGDCDRDIDLKALGLPARKLRTRKLQLFFPDDAGTSIATVSYPTEQAARWEPLFEATIANAKGVATRLPPPSPGVFAAWAAAGAAIGWLLGFLLLRKRDA